MEIATSAFFGGIKRYRRRRRYHRLGGRKKDPRRRNWRFNFKIRLVPKLRPRVIIPQLKLLRRLRDAYVKMMLSFAGHLVQLNGGNVFLAKKIPDTPNGNVLAFSSRSGSSLKV